MRYITLISLIISVSLYSKTIPDFKMIELRKENKYIQNISNKYISNIPIYYNYSRTTKELWNYVMEDIEFKKKVKNTYINSVSYYEVIEFLNKLSKIKGYKVAYNLKKGALLDKEGEITYDLRKVEGFRLPSEVEWLNIVNKVQESEKFNLEGEKLKYDICGDNFYRNFKFLLKNGYEYIFYPRNRDLLVIREVPKNTDISNLLKSVRKPLKKNEKINNINFMIVRSKNFINKKKTNKEVYKPLKRLLEIIDINSKYKFNKRIFGKRESIQPLKNMTLDEAKAKLKKRTLNYDCIFIGKIEQPKLELINVDISGNGMINLIYSIYNKKNEIFNETNTVNLKFDRNLRDMYINNKKFSPFENYNVLINRKHLKYFKNYTEKAIIEIN